MFFGIGAEVCAQARAEGLELLEPTMGALVRHLQAATDGFDPATHHEATPHDRHGWMDPNIMWVFTKLGASAAAAAAPLLLVEVGSWKGQSSCAFAKRLKSLGDGHRLVCIDTWLGAPEFWTWGLLDRSRGGSLRPRFGLPTVYYTFLANVFRQGLQGVVAPLPISSVQGAQVLAHYGCAADAVYVDGAHEHDAVLADLNAYWPLVRPGGVIFGDDYCAEWPGVVAAVEAFAAARRLSVEVRGIVWFVSKPAADAECAAGVPVACRPGDGAVEACATTDDRGSRRQHERRSFASGLVLGASLAAGAGLLLARRAVTCR